MSTTVMALIAALAVWMGACAWCGFRARHVLFFGVLLAGLALNMAWMILGLDAKPFESNALIAQAAAVFYGVSAFGAGWLVGRIAQLWRESRVEG